MWLLYALLAALFSSIATILAKRELRKVSSNFAALAKTIVVLLFLNLIVIFKKEYFALADLTFINYLVIVLSGIVSALSWLSYFKALKIGCVSKVAPIDKGNVILTMLLGIIFLQEKINIYIICAMIIIFIGIVFMTFSARKKENDKSNQEKGWMMWAIIAAVSASVANILAKLSFDGDVISPNLSLTLRTIVVLIVMSIAVVMTKTYKEFRSLNKKTTIYLGLTGLMTFLWWYFYFKSLSMANASLVIPVERLSIIFTIIFSIIFLKEKITKKNLVGVILVFLGTILLIIENFFL